MLSLWYQVKVTQNAVRELNRSNTKDRWERKKITRCSIQEKISNVGLGLGQEKKIHGNYTWKWVDGQTACGCEERRPGAMYCNIHWWEVFLYQNWQIFGINNDSFRTKTRLVVVGNNLRWKKSNSLPNWWLLYQNE